jgi:hypothetical protein
MRTGFIEGAILLALTSAGVSGAALGIATTLLTGAVVLGASVGLNYLASSLFRPAQPKPEDVQQSFRQATAPRWKHYGRVKASGPWVFGDAKAGNFHKVIALGVGPVDAIEQIWFDDKDVTPSMDADGHVETPPWSGPGHRSLLRIQHRLGLDTETSYSALTSVFPEWTAAHRGDRVASLYLRQYPSDQEYFLTRFPNGINSNLRAVMRGTKCVPFGGGTPVWRDNAASVIYDYVRSSDGMRMPASVLDTPLALAGWTAAFNRADQNIPLKGGGTEKRYRLWGSYSLEERPADVLARMLVCCDGRLVPTPDGGLTLDIGAWAEPTVTIDADTITGFTELGRSRDVLSSANTIRATFLDPSQDYQASEADPWADAADVAERGEFAQDFQFNMAPSHGQARRLMKLAAYRANPNWVGTFQCNLRALAAFGERFVRISYPMFGINSVFEVQDFQFNIGEGGILTGVTIQVQSMPPAAYAWNPDQEEGDAPVSDDTEFDDSIPVPPPPTVTFVGVTARLAFSPSPSVLLSYQARYKTTAGSTWTDSGTLPNDASEFITGALTGTTEYDFQLRFITNKGLPGDWSPVTTATTP